jgi:hypothetical protein
MALLISVESASGQFLGDWSAFCSWATKDKTP